MCMWVPTGPKGGVRNPEVGIIEGCEPPKVGDGNSIQVVWKSRKCSSPLSHPSAPASIT